MVTCCKLVYKSAKVIHRIAANIKPLHINTHAPIACCKMLSNELCISTEATHIISFSYCPCNIHNFLYLKKYTLPYTLVLF